MRDDFDEFDDDDPYWRESRDRRRGGGVEDGPGFWQTYGLAIGCVTGLLVIGAIIFVSKSDDEQFGFPGGDADAEVDPIWGNDDPGSPLGAERRTDEPRVPDDALAVGRDVDDAEIVARFEALADIANLHDSDARFRRMVDAERAVDACGEAGDLDVGNHFYRQMLANQLRSEVYCPLEFDEFRLRHLERLPTGEAVVHGLFWSTEGTIFEMRWWLIRRGGDWRFYDWEMMQRGMRQSREDTIHRHSGDVEYTAYSRMVDHMNAAIDADDEQVFQREMQRAIALVPTCDPGIRDLQYYDLADTYQVLGHVQEADALLGRIAQPGSVPGVDLILATNRIETARRSQLDADWMDAAARLEAYGRRIPGGPNVDSGLGEALFALGRDDEARPHLERSLQFSLEIADPNISQQLRRYLATLPEPSIVALIDGVRARDDAPDRLFEMATRQWGEWSDVVLEEVGEFLAKREPISGRSEYCLALARSRQGYDRAAYELMQTVRSRMGADGVEQFPQVDYVQYEAARNGGFTLAAYEDAEDKPRAFRFLIGSDEDDDGPLLDGAPLQELLEAHRPTNPNDPYLALMDAYAAADAGDHTAVLAAVARGREHHDPDDADQEYDGYEFDSLALDARIESGQWVEAYEDGDDRSARFASVGRALRWRDRFDELKELLKRHRDAGPEDRAMRADLEAAMAEEEGDAARADELLARATNLMPEEDWRRNQFVHRRVALRGTGDLPWTDYDDLGPADVVIPSLVSSLRTHEKYDESELLVDRWERIEGRSVEILMARAITARARDDDATLVRIVGSVPPNRWLDGESPWQAQRLGSMYVESLIRLGRIDDAIAWIDDNPELVNDVSLRLRALIAGRRPEECVAHLRASREARTHSRLYDDSELGPILRSPEFAGVRTLLRRSLPSWYTGRTTLLLGENTSIDEQSLLAAARSTFGETARVVAIDAEQIGATRAWRVEAEATRVLVSSREGRSTDINVEHDAPPEIETAIAEHTATLSIAELLTGGEDDPNPDWRLVASLLDEDVLAVAVSNHYRVFSVGDELRTYLAEGEYDFERANDLAGVLGSVGTVERDYHRELRIRSGLNRVHAVLREPRGRFARVIARIGEGLQSERISVRLSGTEVLDRSNWPRTVYVGTLESDSGLLPELTAGTRIDVDLHEIVDWEIVEGGNVVRGSESIDPEADGPG